MRTCTTCGELKAEKGFSPSRPRTCRQCNNEYFRQYRLDHPEARRRATLRDHNLTLEQYAEMLQAQGGVCASCGHPEPIQGWHLAVDHDHSCCPGKKSCGQCIRGLICSSCNRAIGFANDDPDRLQACAEYLRRTS